MQLGTSIFLIAVGAILRYAATFHISGVSRDTVGLILMIAGIVGIVFWLIFAATARRRAFVDPSDRPL